jgi:hypothetical protein
VTEDNLEVLRLVVDKAVGGNEARLTETSNMASYIRASGKSVKQDLKTGLDACMPGIYSDCVVEERRGKCIELGADTGEK